MSSTPRHRCPGNPRRLRWVAVPLVLVCLAALVGVAEEKKTSPRKYFGADACKSCHPEPYRIWAGSPHSRSFVALQTATARKISNEPQGYAGLLTEKMKKECTPCHARGMDVPKAERGDYHPENGVQCEVCHETGSNYPETCLMRDPARGPAPDLGKLGGEHCMGCHKPRESHAILERPPFDYGKSFPRIDHRKKSETK